MILDNNLRLLTDKLQNELRKLLEGYMNGLFMDPPSVIFYPWLNRHIFKIEHNQDNILVISEILGEKYDIESAKKLHSLIFALGKKTRVGSLSLARIISLGYQVLDVLLGKIANRGKAEIYSIAKINLKVYRDRDHKAVMVKELALYARKHLAVYLRAFIVHGSMATLDYTDFSDLDTLIVIKKEIIENPRALCRLQKLVYSSTRYLYLADPYQHHGHFLLTEFDLLYYPQEYFPAEILPYSKSILWRNRLEIKKRDCSLEIRGRLKNTSEGLRQSAISENRPHSVYTAKFLISNILLVPTILLMSRYEFGYKRDSFLRIQSLIPEPDREILIEASSIRQEWRIDRTLIYFLNFLYKFMPSPLSVNALRNRIDRGMPRWLQVKLDNNFFKKLDWFSRAIKAEERVNKWSPSGSPAPLAGHEDFPA